MTVHIFGFSIYEFGVFLTDLLLFVELILFAFFLFAIKPRILLQKLFVSLFVFLSMAALLGAMFHGFFPRQDATHGGYIIWLLVATFFGLAASVLWCINGLLFKGRRICRIVRPLVAAHMAVFLYIMLYVSYQFKIIILFYSLPSIAIIWFSMRRFLQERIYVWLGLSAGFILVLVAGVLQYLQIGLHPVYFNQNVLYHAVLWIALAIIFVSVRFLVKNKTIK